MSTFRVALKNINLGSIKLILTIVLLGIGLSAVTTVNIIADSMIRNAKEANKNLEADNRIHVSTLNYREITQEEISYVSNLEGVSSVILDYNMSLMLANDEGQVIYQSKIQQFDSDLDFTYSLFKEEEDGIILPDITIEDSAYPTDLAELYGKQVYFMIDRTMENGEVSVEEYPVKVVGLYETKLSQHTSSIFITPKLLKDIQEFAKFDATVYGFDILIEQPKNVEKIAHLIEEIGLDTVYPKKSLQSSIDNIKSFVLMIEIFSYVIIILGIIVLLLFTIGKIKKREKEIAILKIIGYSTNYVACSILLELIFYMVLSSLTASFLINFFLDALKYRLPFAILSLSILSNQMLVIYIKNLSILSLISGIVVLVLSFRIYHIRPLTLLKDN